MAHRPFNSSLKHWSGGLSVQCFKLKSTTKHDFCRMLAASTLSMQNGPQRSVSLYGALHQQQRHYSQLDKDSAFRIIEYNDIGRMIENRKAKYRLIDVREEKEVKDGFIPTAYNVPLSQFPTAWRLSSEEFKERFGFAKPEKKDNLVVYCLAGVRSTKAAEYLAQLGYENLGNYVGSWADYVEQQRKEEKK